MDPVISKLEQRIAKLEKNQIAATMNYEADLNILRSLNRALVTKTLKVGQAGTLSASISALIELSSISKGFVFSRMTTTQRDAITSPIAGLVIYNTTTGVLNFYNGAAWGAV